MIDGTVKKIRYDSVKGKYMVEFDRPEVTFEFRNGKKNRADTIRKMKLREGEHVIAIGARKDGLPLYAYGWELKRNGSINAGGMYMVRGDVLSSVTTPSCSLISLKTEDKVTTVKAGHGADVGSCISILCTSALAYECPTPCSGWGTDRCKECKKMKKERRFTAFRSEKEDLSWNL